MSVSTMNMPRSSHQMPPAPAAGLGQNTREFTRVERGNVQMPGQHDVVLGVDSSTQSTKVVAIDLETGAVVSEGRAPHTGASTQHPEDWWSALRTAVHV